MVGASTFLRRALLADAVFSGVAALGFTFGAGSFPTLFNLPKALLRETGLFLIAYTALVGWLASRPVVPKPLVLLVVVGNAAWTMGSIPLLFSGTVSRLTGELMVVAQAIPTVCSRITYVGCARAGVWWRRDRLVSRTRCSVLRCCAEPRPTLGGWLAETWPRLSSAPPKWRCAASGARE